MARRPTITDVAKATGVAPGTVLRAFRSDTSSESQTRARVTQAAADLGYVFDRAASSLRWRKSGFVAAIKSSLNNASFADTIAAKSAVLERNGLQILLGSTNYSIDEEERLIEKMLQRGPEAIVLTGGHRSQRARDILARASVAIVETWDLPEDPIGHVVGVSNKTAMQGLVDHCVDKGMTKIAFLGGDASGDLCGRDRLVGSLDALERLNLKASRLITARPAPVAMREGALAMEHLLKIYPDTEAVACVSDLTAFGAMTGCQRRGIRVPEDIAIAGFGAYATSAFAHPTITTIEAFSAEIGRKAGTLISELLRGETPPEGPHREEIRPHFVVRELTP